MAKKRVLVMCGSGIASSTVCGQKILKECKAKGIDVEVKCIAFREAQGQVMGADLVVTVTPGFKMGNTPVINGVAFLTGLGERSTLDEIIKVLKR